MGKYIRKIMVALLYVATFGISVAIFVSNYLCKFMLGSRKHLRKAKEKDLLTRKQEQNRLFMSANGIDAYITSWDGLELHAAMATRAMRLIWEAMRSASGRRATISWRRMPGGLARARETTSEWAGPNAGT